MQNNPFSNCGSIIRGGQFIGRLPELRQINERLIKPWDGGNIAIVGDYRIGKSSLAYNAVMEKREELRAKGICPLWLNIGKFATSLEVFRAMVRACSNELEEAGKWTDALQNAKDRVFRPNLSWDEEREYIEQFFTRVRRAQIKVIVVLDEFDHTRVLFKDDIAAFQFLRDLSYYPDWKVSFLICSRRTIKDIELQTAAISTFDGTCISIYLQTFSGKEQDLFFAMLSDAGIQADPSMREQFAWFTGGHPFLMGVLASSLMEIFLEAGVADMAAATNACKYKFIDTYDHTTSMLKEDNSLVKLVQILFGPSFDVDKIEDISRLERFGFIKLNSAGQYQSYSPHFQAYLKIIGRSLDHWPAWKEMENRLRTFLDVLLKKRFGDNWIEIVESQSPEMRIIVKKWREERDTAHKYFDRLASNDFIEFASPSDLLTIALSQMDDTNPFLSDSSSSGWYERARLLAHLQSPLSSNADLSQNRKDAEVVCEEIFMALDRAF